MKSQHCHVHTGFNQLRFDIAPIYSKIIGGVFSGGVNSVTSMSGESNNPTCFPGKLGLEKGPFGAYPKLNTEAQLTLKIASLKSSWKSVLDQFQVALSRFEESYGYHANQHEKLMLRLNII